MPDATDTAAQTSRSQRSSSNTGALSQWRADAALSPRALYHAVATPPQMMRGDDELRRALSASMLAASTSPPSTATTAALAAPVTSHSHAHALSVMLGARRGSNSSTNSNTNASRSRSNTTDSMTPQQLQQSAMNRHYQIQQSPDASNRSSNSSNSNAHILDGDVAVASDKASWADMLQQRWRQRRLRARRAVFWTTALGVFLAGFALTFVLPPSLQRLAPIVLGSLLSLVSALVIVVSYLLQPQTRRYPNELLVYVALCELGLALLALVHTFVLCTGRDSASALAVCAPLAMRACSVVAALEMFLLLASVGWFGAAILHLFVSVSNPFANYKSQLTLYHSVVWTGSIAVAVAVPLVVFGQSFQDQYDMSSVELCRAVGLVLPMLPAVTTVHEQQTRIRHWQELNAAFWGTLFALVVLLVVAAQSILVVGWWRSNSGTVIALKARRRMMKRMTIYVHTLNATWLVLLVAFFVYRANANALAQLPTANDAYTQDSAAKVDSTSNSDGDGGVHLLSAIFHYLLAAKGYFTCVVWVSVNKRGCGLGALRCCSRSDVTAAGRTPTDDGGHDHDDDDDSETDPANAFQAYASSSHVFASSTSSLVLLENGAAHTAATRSSEPLAAAQFGNSSSSNSSGSSSSDSRASLSSWASQNNATLQREIIYYTVCGITKSILKALQSPDATIVSQQLLVGAERDSAFANNSIISHVQTLDTMSSPRPFCEPNFSKPLLAPAAEAMMMTPAAGAMALRRRLPGDSCNSTECTAASSSPLDGSSFLSASASSQPAGLSSSFTGSSSYHYAPPPRSSRFSLYPVSQVPFELFDHDIELQSNRSSSSSLGLSPLFAGLRRTAFGHSGGPTTTPTSTPTKMEDPKPKVFVDYAPNEFRAVRRAFGLSDEAYLASFRTTAKERISAGSSGAFMFFSGDNALIVKSMKEKECRKLVKMAPAYAAYIQHNAKSRIIRFFGCHRIRLYGRNFYFVVMSNVLHSERHAATIAEKYDIKGSWIDRRARRPQLGDTVACSECNASYVFGREDAATTFPFHMHQPDTILKDLDMDRKLHLPRNVAVGLHAQLVADCEFLNAMGIMDYSLLVGVHKCRLQQPATDPWLSNTVSSSATAIHEDRDSLGASWSGSNLAPLGEPDATSSDISSSAAAGGSDDAMEVYFVGIIDILQEWDWEKQIEKVGKMLLGKPGDGISAIPPDAYCERFKTRIAQILLGDDTGKDSISIDSEAPAAVTQKPERAAAPVRTLPPLRDEPLARDSSTEDAEAAFQREAASIIV